MGNWESTIRKAYEDGTLAKENFEASFKSFDRNNSGYLEEEEIEIFQRMIDERPSIFSFPTYGNQYPTHLNFDGDFKMSLEEYKFMWNNMKELKENFKQLSSSKKDVYIGLPGLEEFHMMKDSIYTTQGWYDYDGNKLAPSANIYFHVWNNRFEYNRSYEKYYVIDREKNLLGFNFSKNYTPSKKEEIHIYENEKLIQTIVYDSYFAPVAVKLVNDKYYLHNSSQEINVVDKEGKNTLHKLGDNGDLFRGYSLKNNYYYFNKNGVLNRVEDDFSVTKILEDSSLLEIRGLKSLFIGMKSELDFNVYSLEGKLISTISIEKLGKIKPENIISIAELESGELTIFDSRNQISLWSKDGQFISLIYYDKSGYFRNEKSFDKVLERDGLIYAFRERNMMSIDYKDILIKNEFLLKQFKENKKEEKKEEIKEEKKEEKKEITLQPQISSTDPFELLKENKLNEFKLLVENRTIDVNSISNEDRSSLLLKSLQEIKFEFFDYLLQLPKDKFNLNVNHVNAKGNSVLLESVEKSMKIIIESLLKDERVDLSLKNSSQNRIIDEITNEEISKLISNYRKPVVSGADYILLNKRTGYYLGIPTKTTDGWDCGSLYPLKGKNNHIFTHESLPKEKDLQLFNGDSVRIQTQESNFVDFNFLYCSTSGWGYYDKFDDNQKQIWKIQKVNQKGSKCIERGIFIGDTITIENSYYPGSYLYSNVSSYTGTSKVYVDEWMILNGEKKD